MPKITALTELDANPASGDLVVIVDVSASSTKKITISNLIGTTLTLPLFKGALQRPQFDHSDTDTLLISSGWYEHNGTSQQICYWDSQLTFELGPAGSNADSSAIGTSEWQYLYLDDSAIVTAGTNLLTASEFVASTTAPTWSQAKHGWYNGNDRCIFAGYINSAGNFFIWRHDGGRYVMFDESWNMRALADLDTTHEIVTLNIPGFATKAQVNIRGYANAAAAAADLYIGVQGTTNDGVYVGLTQSGDGAREYNTFEVFTDSSQQVEIWHSVDGDHQAALSINGWYLPRGM